jgi:ribosomal protein L27
MRDARVSAIDISVDSVVVRARGLHAAAARELGAGITQTLPAALAGAVERAHGTPYSTASAGPVEFASLAVQVKNAPRGADLAASAGSAAATALASRLAQPKDGAR